MSDHSRDQNRMRRREATQRLKLAWQRIEYLEGKNRRLRNALKEAYRLTDAFCRDMSDEAFQELEQHFINALDGAEGGQS